MTAALTLNRTLLLARDAEMVGTNTVTDAQLLAALRGTRVLVVADASNLASIAAQDTVVGLVGLLARLGVRLGLAFPDVPIRGHQPPLKGERLLSALLDFCADVIPECHGEEWDPDAAVDVAYVVGDTAWRGRAPVALRLSAGPWSAETRQAESVGTRIIGDFPVGPLAAAGLAAPEAFKAAMRRLGAHLPTPVATDFLRPVHAARVTLAPEGTPTGPFPVADVDLISGGAITSASLFMLARVPDLSFAGRVIEPERLDLTNLNRYPFQRRSDGHAFKAEALRAWMPRGIALEPVLRRYDAAAADALAPLTPRVLVGVDDIPTRWLVQRQRPAWVGVGATSHFMAVVSSHRPGEPCVGCLHPYDDPDDRAIPTVSFVSHWAGLLLAARLLLSTLSHDPVDLEQSTFCWPLLFDQPRAYWPRPVPRHGACPVGCATL